MHTDDSGQQVHMPSLIEGRAWGISCNLRAMLRSQHTPALNLLPLAVHVNASQSRLGARVLYCSEVPNLVYRLGIE